jgi:hypothetical protein
MGGRGSGTAKRNSGSRALQKKTVWLGGGCATDRQSLRAAAGCPPEWCNSAGSRCNERRGRERDGGCALAKWREGAAKLHAIPKEGTAQTPSCSGHSSVSRPQPFKLASLSPGNGRPAPCVATLPGVSQQLGVRGRWPKLEQCAPLSLLCLLPPESCPGLLRCRPLVCHRLGVSATRRLPWAPFFVLFISRVSTHVKGHAAEFLPKSSRDGMDAHVNLRRREDSGAWVLCEA